ncbi:MULTISPECIES: hypothetical protein [unclassified Rhodococcus (in: high G+C Gram-positive bacteria)]|uniref:hypothetical protein n=1 Tax=unclassified Rhodococcus (in: high G+C Gram-positive bacteria) TaxID=192944 RepID=UPI00289DC384|nr:MULTISPECIES: hypothetical protein [unclassified Rhodococcus (in: high G+C Gram-positive bacteria)]
MTTLRGPALALLRFNYHLVRIPLQLAEWGVLSRFDEQASTRLAYEQLLIDCDRLAARLLGDEEAARRADDLDRHIVLVRTVIARNSYETQRRGVLLLDEQRERFQRRRRERKYPGAPL